MERVEFKYSYYSWGNNKEELYVIDFQSKLYLHYDKGQLDDKMLLPDDLLNQIRSLFEPIYEDFPKDVFAYDAPMWTLTIDDKTCTRIAVQDADAWYERVSAIFNAFKRN